MRPFAALPLLALAGCSVCQPTRFTWPVFDDPIAALITASDSGQTSDSGRTSANGSSVVNAPPSQPVAETPSAPSQPVAETPTTQTPSASSTDDGVGGQQETREESHDRG